MVPVNPRTLSSDRRLAAIPAFPIGGKAAFHDAAADFERVRVRERLPGGTVGSRVEPPKVPDLSADRAVIQIRVERERSPDEIPAGGAVGVAGIPNVAQDVALVAGAAEGRQGLGPGSRTVGAEEFEDRAVVRTRIGPAFIGEPSSGGHVVGHFVETAADPDAIAKTDGCPAGQDLRRYPDRCRSARRTRVRHGSSGRKCCRMRRYRLFRSRRSFDHSSRT